jgi:DNA-binding phage protein
MYQKEEIRDLVARAGGVHEVSVKTGLRIQTIYRLMRGQNKPSFESNVKLEALENELNQTANA